MSLRLFSREDLASELDSRAPPLVEDKSIEWLEGYKTGYHRAIHDVASSLGLQWSSIFSRFMDKDEIYVVERKE